MPQRLDSFSSQAYFDDALDTLRPAPGKVTSTQRMTASPPSAAAAAAPVQRELDPVAAAVQRKHLEHDLAASMGFLGGPAASIDESIVQMKTDAHTGLSDDAITAHAAAGVSDGGRALPHLDAIQRSFGPHDVSGVRAHVGGAASDAAGAIGAHAYATGNDVAFAREPDLFLAAHEAAHVVQQRQGVHLKGAVGQDGDAYERHADDVAAAVVRGESAADLLGPTAAGGDPAGAVQRKWSETIQSASDSKATITVSSLPDTVATFWATDGSGAHSKNPYGSDSVYSDLKIWPHTQGYVSLDVFALASMGDSSLGAYGWNTQHKIALNAIADTSFVNGKFQSAKRPMNPQKLPDAGVDLVGEHQIVDGGGDPQLLVRMTITPTGQRKESSQGSVKGGMDFTLPIVEKGLKTEGNKSWTSEQSWADGAIRKEYGVLLRLQGGRTGDGGGGGGGGAGGNVSIQNTGGPTNNGTINNGTINNGTIDNGTINNGPVQNGPVNNGTINNGPVNNGPVNNGPVYNGPVNTGTIDNRKSGDTTIGSNNTVHVDATTRIESLFKVIYQPVLDGAVQVPPVPEELRKRTLYFGVDKDTFVPESDSDLENYAETIEALDAKCTGELQRVSPRQLIKDGKWKFDIKGLTSSTGSETYNDGLSNRRAAYAKKRLMRALPIKKENIDPRGAGEDKCVVDNGQNKEVDECRKVVIRLTL